MLTVSWCYSTRIHFAVLAAYSVPFSGHLVCSQGCAAITIAYLVPELYARQTLCPLGRHSRRPRPPRPRAPGPWQAFLLSPPGAGSGRFSGWLALAAASLLPAYTARERQVRDRHQGLCRLGRESRGGGRWGWPVSGRPPGRIGAHFWPVWPPPQRARSPLSGAGVSLGVSSAGLARSLCARAPCQREGRRQLGAGIWPLMLGHRWGPLHTALGLWGAPCLLQAPERPGDPVRGPSGQADGGMLASGPCSSPGGGGRPLIT